MVLSQLGQLYVRLIDSLTIHSFLHACAVLLLVSGNCNCCTPAQSSFPPEQENKQENKLCATASDGDCSRDEYRPLVFTWVRKRRKLRLMREYGWQNTFRTRCYFVSWIHNLFWPSAELVFFGTKEFSRAVLLCWKSSRGRRIANKAITLSRHYKRMCWGLKINSKCMPKTSGDKQGTEYQHLKHVQRLRTSSLLLVACHCKQSSPSWTPPFSFTFCNEALCYFFLSIPHPYMRAHTQTLSEHRFQDKQVNWKLPWLCFKRRKKKAVSGDAKVLYMQLTTTTYLWEQVDFVAVIFMLQFYLVFVCEDYYFL